MKKFLSLLQVKLPILHYRLEGPELLQGVLMIAVGLSTVPVLQETLGMSYSAALTAVAIAEALGLLHVTFGDPVVPGWIASALPLVLVYMANYAVGIEAPTPSSPCNSSWGCCSCCWAPRGWPTS